MINRTKYDGFDSVEIISDKMRAVVVYEIGPRIAFFGKPKGKNLLYWKKDGMERNGWKLYGGHRVWLTRPMADESEDTYLPDNDPCSLEIQNNTVIVTSPENSVNHLVKGMEIELVSENTIKVRNFVRNKGGLIYSGGVWSPTCIVPDNFTDWAMIGGTGNKTIEFTNISEILDSGTTVAYVDNNTISIDKLQTEGQVNFAYNQEENKISLTLEPGSHKAGLMLVDRAGNTTSIQEVQHLAIGNHRIWIGVGAGAFGITIGALAILLTKIIQRKKNAI